MDGFLTGFDSGGSLQQVVPYSVELKVRDGHVYALVSFEERLPELEISRDFGVIGFDVNASPFHLAWAEVERDGNPNEKSF